MPGILETIETPEDLKRLSMAELDELAKELRAFILENVSRTGGHLASSLGAVELTLALHYVFNTPLDKIVWDVGHQAYAHKIVTGRRERFSTLRQYGGLSPFINPNESLYDTFVSGHVGNAISAASGLCEAMRLAGNPNKVIAVIGDGSLSNGLTFEGLNFVGKREQNLIVVLNDNKMSISSTVGALADYLSRIMTSKTVRDLKEEVKTGIRRLPVIGDRIFSMVKYIENNLKGMIAPGVLFEEMGLRYLGPIDGHNISHLVETFKNVSMMKGPIIIHVHTEKGHGYKPAQRNPEHYHGVGKFNLINGESEAKVNGRTYSQVFGDTLVELASKNPRVIAVSAAMTSGTGLKRFAHTFPDRFYDVGIAEG
ncbi:MAG: 1-deoxy-D-xylulose-5-phosphate synthase, partial [Deltaproteobacteria bacterium]